MIPGGLYDGKERQLSQASGGKDPYEKQDKGKCKRCGKTANLKYLVTHGGLCRSCAVKENAPKCPVCGGEMKGVPSGLDEKKKGQLKLQCLNCGQTMFVTIN